VLLDVLDQGLDDRPQLCVPGPGGRRDHHVREKGVTHRGEQLVLVRHVPVERHGRDSELLRDPSNGDRVRALGVHHGQCALDDRGPAQLDLGSAGGGGSGSHGQNYTP
jgi:hypothetical protein